MEPLFALADWNATFRRCSQALRRTSLVDVARAEGICLAYSASRINWSAKRAMIPNMR